jgi:hypothetical protein
MYFFIENLLSTNLDEAKGEPVHAFFINSAARPRVAGAAVE